MNSQGIRDCCPVQILELRCVLRVGIVAILFLFSLGSPLLRWWSKPALLEDLCYRSEIECFLLHWKKKYFVLSQAVSSRQWLGILRSLIGCLYGRWTWRSLWVIRREKASLDRNGCVFYCQSKRCPQELEIRKATFCDCCYKRKINLLWLKGDIHQKLECLHCCKVRASVGLPQFRGSSQIFGVFDICLKCEKISGFRRNVRKSYARLEYYTNRPKFFFWFLCA